MKNNLTKKTAFIGSLTIFTFAFAAQGGGGAQGGGHSPQVLDALPTGDLVLAGDVSFARSDVNAAVNKLKEVNLEETSAYTFELSGQTSVNLKFKREGATGGTFVTRNSAANPNTEIAYSNLARILGADQIVRAAIPYTLETNGISVFRRLIRNSTFRGMRAQNANKILIATQNNPNELKGCLREKHKGDDLALDSVVDRANNKPLLSHQLFKDLNAANPVPTEGSYRFSEGYIASRPKVARQYSILMTLDAVFGQWDRYSGGNVVFKVTNAETKEVEVFSTDNGGADFWNTTKWAERQVSWFSRYDRETIEQIRALYSFLIGEATSLHSVRLDKTWTEPTEFVKDLGLYYEKRPEQYVAELSKNIAVLLRAVQANQSRYGNAAFF